MSTLNRLANLVGNMTGEETVSAAEMLLDELTDDQLVELIVSKAGSNEMLADELVARLEDFA